MTEAEWILTFDDGPLPGDVTTWREGRERDLLGPLESILTTLATHLDAPIPAVFFLRGPAYPWKKKPPKSLFKDGVAMMTERRHALGLHCHSHDPDLWWPWPLNISEIHDDLDKCRDFFEPMGPLSSVMRPPYGQGGLAGMAWALQNQFRHRLWDIDAEDWVHHPELGVLQRFGKPAQAAAHLKHVTDGLPLKMWLHTAWPGANDFLMHVSVRTANSLPKILDCIVKTTRSQEHEPKFVVPDWYLRP